jgi:hypothetical protein
MEKCLKDFINENMDEEGVLKVLKLTNDEDFFFVIKEETVIGFSENLFEVVKFYKYTDVDGRIFSAETYQEFKDEVRRCIFELKPYLTFEDLIRVFDYSETSQIHQDNMWLQD